MTERPSLQLQVQGFQWEHTPASAVAGPRLSDSETEEAQEGTYEVSGCM